MSSFVIYGFETAFEDMVEVFLPEKDREELLCYMRQKMIEENEILKENCTELNLDNLCLENLLEYTVALNLSEELEERIERYLHFDGFSLCFLYHLGSDLNIVNDFNKVFLGVKIIDTTKDCLFEQLFFARKCDVDDVCQSFKKHFDVIPMFYYLLQFQKNGECTIRQFSEMPKITLAF